MKNIINTGKLSSLLCILVLSQLLVGCAVQNLAKQQTEIDSKAASLKMNAAQQAIKSADYGAAELYALDMLNDDRKNEGALFLLANIQAATNRKSQSMRTLNNLIKVNPDHVQARILLGEENLRRGNLVQAEYHLKRALSLDSNQWKTNNMLGVISDLKGKFGEATRYYQRAVNQRPREGKILNNFAFSNYLRGNLQAAESILVKLLAIDYNNQAAWSNLALVQAKKGNTSLAVSSLEKIMERHKALNNVGYLSQLANKQDAAQALLKESIKISPEFYNKAHLNLKNL